LWFYQPVGQTVLKKSTATIAVSRWEQEQLAADFGVESRIIPNGIEVDRFRNATPAETTKPTLLTVGRLVEYKGIQHVIRALSDLPEYRLRIAGCGPYRDALGACAREAGVFGRVEFLGYVPDPELPSQYAAADVFISMSSVEAAGITVGEALAAGTPAVVRPSKGLRDWTQRDDCLAADPATLATVIKRARSRSAPSEPLPMWHQVVDEMESVYRSVISSTA
jgi:glycosyltransferase involved in cell wall biosynthesis